MKDSLAFLILAVLVGCSVQAPPKQAVVLLPGTKIITPTPQVIRDAFGVDAGRTGQVVELDRPLVLSEPGA